MEAWEITDEKVQAVINRIIEVGKPVSLILFGSYIRGQIKADSDLDILVVVGEDVKNCRHESVRIRRALKGILLPMDIIVIRWEDLRKYADTPGWIYSSALKEGRLVYEKAA